MSRYQVEDTNGNTFAYGFDPPMSTYFWQVYSNSPSRSVDTVEPMIDEGGISPRTGGQLLEAMRKYGVEEVIDREYPHHRTQAALDIPIGDPSMPIL